jgi:hypothetical protein
MHFNRKCTFAGQAKKLEMRTSRATPLPNMHASIAWAPEAAIIKDASVVASKTLPKVDLATQQPVGPIHQGVCVHLYCKLHTFHRSLQAPTFDRTNTCQALGTVATCDDYAAIPSPMLHTQLAVASQCKHGSGLGLWAHGAALTWSPIQTGRLAFRPARLFCSECGHRRLPTSLQGASMSVLHSPMQKKSAKGQLRSSLTPLFAERPGL